MQSINYFIPVCMAIIEKTNKLTKKSADDLTAARTKICHLIDNIDKAAADNQCNLEMATMIKYAMVSYVDEWVMTHSNQGSSWGGNSLQLEYFRENSAGEGFFSHLETIMANPQAMLYALEIYYLVLQLGFEGRYRVREREKLNFITAQVHSLVTEVKVKSNGLLVTTAPVMDKLDAVSREIPLWVMGCVSFASASIISVVYSMMINYKVQAINNTIISAAKQMGYLVFG